MSDTLGLPRAVREALDSVNSPTSRRNFLKASGALVLTIGGRALPGGEALAQAASGPYPDPDYLERYLPALRKAGMPE